MRSSHTGSSEPPRGKDRRYPLLLKMLRIILTVVYFFVGTALVLLSYLVWENNDLIETIAGSALFLVGGASFVAMGIKEIGKWKRGW
jgi:uncharacterized membrane protein YqjE